MRTIVAGSRGVTNYVVVKRAIESAPWEVSCVISGTAKGVDQLGEDWAEIHNIPVERYPADWVTLGRRAGYVRNTIMAKNAEALVAIWDTKSKGTYNMIEIARKYQLKIHIVEVSNEY